MAKRHRLNPHDRESILLRLQELLMANSGEDAYEEAFKLLLAKLYDELQARATGLVQFKRIPRSGATREAIEGILKDASARWPDAVGSTTIKLEDDHLGVCVEEIAQLQLLDHNIEIIDDLFEHLVSADAKGNKGQYFTPRHVIDFAIKIVEPKSGESVVDPSCGSGGFLVHALTYMRGGTKKEVISDEDIWGFDFDPRAARVARTLLRIAGVENPNIHPLNSLVKPLTQKHLFTENSDTNGSNQGPTIETVMSISKKKKFEGFDVLFANPPFAGEIREDAILESYEVSRGRSSIERDAIFIERCVELLRAGGRFAIVLPHNKLASSAWGPLRAWLLRHISVKVVIGLPRATFAPHTHQKAALLIGLKRHVVLPHPPKDEEVLFSVSDMIGKDTSGRVILRKGARPEDSMWDRADHDLAELVDVGKGHLWAVGDK